MDFILHQNLRRFVGTHARTRAYGRQLQLLQSSLIHGHAQNIAVARNANPFQPRVRRVRVTGEIVAAGFTEVSGRNVTASINQISQRMSLTSIRPVICGSTLFSYTESVAMAYDARSYTLLSIGRCLIQRGRGAPLLHDHIAQGAGAPPARQISAFHNTLPQAAAPDYRGLVYMVLQKNGRTPIAIGFIHNMYSLAMQRLVTMATIPAFYSAMLANPAMAGARVPGTDAYIGGDFNISPKNQGTASRNRTWVHHAALGQMPPGASARRGTTWGGNTYDYWYTQIGAPNPASSPNAVVDGCTMSGAASGNHLMSDHCAALLAID